MPKYMTTRVTINNSDVEVEFDPPADGWILVSQIISNRNHDGVELLNTWENVAERIEVRAEDEYITVAAASRRLGLNEDRPFNKMREMLRNRAHVIRTRKEPARAKTGPRIVTTVCWRDVLTAAGR